MSQRDFASFDVVAQMTLGPIHNTAHKPAISHGIVGRRRQAILTLRRGNGIGHQHRDGHWANAARHRCNC